VILPDGRKFLGDFLLRNFGCGSGMIVVQNYSRLAGYWEELEKLGYGFATLNPQKAGDYNRQGFIEMLSEWSWKGDPKKRPSWVIPYDELGFND
jgi:hypothetical protein